MASGGSIEKDSVFYKKVINKCRIRFIEDLDPIALLDVFLAEEYFTVTQERDVRELTNTSEKNREILTKVSTKGVKGYIDFKKCLEKSRQEHLAEYLDTTAAKLEEEMLAAEETLPTVNNRTGFKCSVCDLSFDTVHHLVQHTQTPAHMDMIKEQQEFAKENQEENGAEETSDYTGLSSSMHEQNAIDCSDQVSKCYLCNVNFTSPSHANSHFNGKPHKRKKALFDFKLQQPIPSSTGNESIKKSSENVDQPDSQISLPLQTLGSSNTTVSTELTCDICNVPFSSIINAQQHYNSENHKKKALLLHKQKLGEALPTSCDICNCCFSGPESAEAHFKSEKHRKMENKKQNLGEALPTSCDICNCSFSGPESAEAHFKSEKHKKRENKKQKLGEALPTSCDICNCSFNGPESAEAHFKSEKHKKRENKAILEDTESLSLSCDICICTFTSEENAKQHFDGNKHRKNLALHASGDVKAKDTSLSVHHDGQGDPYTENDTRNPTQNGEATVQRAEDEMATDLENLSLFDE